MNKDYEWQIVSEFGKLGIMHLIDMNSNRLPTELPYTDEMKKIEITESKLRDIRRLYDDYKQVIKPIDNIEEYEMLTRQFGQSGSRLILDDIKRIVTQSHSHLFEQEALLKNQLETYKAILQKIAVWDFTKQLAGSKRPSIHDFMKEEEAPATSSENLIANAHRFIYLGGVLPNEDLAQLRRMMVRVSKGKVLVQSTPFVVDEEHRLIEDWGYGEGKFRSVYVLIFEDGDYLPDKVKKLASSFRDPKVPAAETYEIQINELSQNLNEYIVERENIQRVIKQSRNVQRDFLVKTNEDERI
jgi:vacuolar-type H+-ATPase subunit I/STV1